MAVYNRADQSIPDAHYDIAVIGGGLCGLAAAFQLRQREPESRLIIIEQDGIPSEEGATQYSPAIQHRFFSGSTLRERAARWREDLGRLEELTGAKVPFKNGFRPCGVYSREPAHLALAREHSAEFSLITFAELCREWPNVRHFLAAEEDAEVAHDPLGGCGNADAVALHFGYGAVALGADLCLNARAAFSAAGEVLLDRLTINNRMQVEVAQQTKIQAGRLVLAAGAATASLVENYLGETLPLPRYFTQFPRLGREAEFEIGEDGGLRIPVLFDQGFAIRPHHDGAIVIPPALPADPEGYAPTGGKFMGVQVGLRREHLLAFAAALPLLPALSRSTLNLGKTPQHLRRMWEVVAPGGVPAWLPIPDGPHGAIVGGANAFALGPWRE